MRGTKKYKIVKCFRHFGAIIILLWLISIVRFPYYIITAKRIFIWNRYDLSQLMPFSEETSYSYTDCFTKVNVVQSGNTLCLYEEGYVQPYILSFLFLCVVLILNILGDKSTPEK